MPERRMSNKQISRRTALHGLGVCMALPPLEAMVSSSSAAANATRAPKRMAFVYSPNGKNMEQWRPKDMGSNYTLSPTLEPLAALKGDFQVLSGLDHRNATNGGDGAGDHARANATFLTGMRAKKTAGADIRLGVSVDQVAAQQLGKSTRLPSLELSCDAARRSGKCDSGYGCAYQYNISWRDKKVPMPPEANPRLVFERLFGKDTAGGGNKAERLRQARQQKSILDFVMEDAKRLQSRLGGNDRAKLEEYFTAVRETERRVENAEKFATAAPDMKKPDGIPGSYKEHIRLLYDLSALAFQSDTTRIATFMMAHDGSNRNFREIGVPDGHHNISHHGNDRKKLEKIAKIDRFYIEQFAYFLNKLKGMKDVDGRSVLDNSMIVYGCGIADGNRHNHHDLPVLLAGRGGGTIEPGRHLDFRGEVPLSNLYVTMLDKLGLEVSTMGDSTGSLPRV
jgi:hypothetical protein